MPISRCRFGRRVPFGSVGSPTTFSGIELANQRELYRYNCTNSFIVYSFCYCVPEALISLLSAKTLKYALGAKGIQTTKDFKELCIFTYIHAHSRSYFECGHSLGLNLAYLNRYFVESVIG